MDLHNADIHQLMAWLALQEEIVCVHPGGPRIMGSDAIRSAHEDFFDNRGPKVIPNRVHVKPQGLRMMALYSIPFTSTEAEAGNLFMVLN